MYKNILSAVVTSNWNQGRFFKRYMNSLLDLTVKPDFIVWVDDFSTDNSWDIILDYFKIIGKPEKFSDIVKGIKFIGIRKEQNGGQASGRNVAIKEVIDKVQVICSLDSDDEYLNGKISKSIDIMLKYPQVGIVYSDYFVQDSNLVANQRKREYKEPFSYRKLSQECIVSTNSVFKADIIKKIGLYDEHQLARGVEDYDYNLRISEESIPYHIPESLFIYNLHGQNITVTTPPPIMGQRVQYVHQKKIQRLQARGLNAG